MDFELMEQKKKDFMDPQKISTLDFYEPARSLAM